LVILPVNNRFPGVASGFIFPDDKDADFDKTADLAEENIVKIMLVQLEGNRARDLILNRLLF